MLMRLLVLRANRWLAAALALTVTASVSHGQTVPNVPTASTKSLSLLRGPPLNQRTGTTLAVPVPVTVNGVTGIQFFSTGIPDRVALYPNHNNISALNNGSLQLPGFVYNILPPSAVGGSSGGLGGGIGGGISGGIGGGIGGIGGGISGGIGGGICGGIGGGIGGISGGIGGGIGGIGGGVGGFGGFAYPNGGTIGGGGGSFQGGLSSALGTANQTTTQQNGFGGFGGGFGGVMGALGGRGF
jgi:hypothetical protein